MRIVGIDFGERRIGLAMSDASGTLASPIRVIDRRGASADAVTLVMKAIAEIARGEPIDRIVIGLPRRLDGTDNDQTPHVRAFAAALGVRSGLPIELQDERLSSREAEARLAVGERDWRKRKARLDAAAAAIVLQDWLDARPRAEGL
jgi:putative Holliday junction resolvase